jgi:MFS family permease
VVDVGRLVVSMAFQFQSIAAVSQFLVVDLALDYSKLGLLVGIYMLPGVAISLPGGMLGARFGNKTIALSGLLMMIVGGAMSGLADQYAMAVAGRLVSGIGAVLLNVMLTKMTSDWFAGRGIITAMAILVSSWPLDIGLALATEPLLATAYTWSAAFHATAASALVGFLLLAVVYCPATPGAAPITGRLSSGITRPEFVSVSLAGMMWALYNVSYILLVSFAPSLLIARGLSVADAGFATSLATWTLMVSLPLGGVVIERIGRPVALIAINLALMEFTIALVAIAGNSRWIIALAGLISGIPAGSIMALPAQVLRPQSRGPGMGAFFMWYYLAMALFPPVAGYLRDLSGDARAPLLFGTCLSFVTVGVVGAFAAFRMVPSASNIAKVR